MTLQLADYSCSSFNLMRPKHAAMTNFFAPLPRFLNTTVLCSASTVEYLLLHSIMFTHHVYLYLYAMFCIKVLIILLYSGKVAWP